ncbi:hypothetical protein D3C79_1061190 [compost metagenome]
MPTSGPIVTQEDWKFLMLSRTRRLIATVFRYSSGVCLSSFRLVLSGWKVQEINARNPSESYLFAMHSSWASRTRSR